VESLRLLEALQRHGYRKITAPVALSDPGFDQLIIDAREAMSLRNEWQKKGELVIEALAYFTQLIFAWKYLGKAATTNLQELITPSKRLSKNWLAYGAELV
jgi:hypothetical protein